ncbi:MAG: hypothetical protein ACYDHY_06605 [Acidiferrobacterales bacterium]
MSEEVKKDPLGGKRIKFSKAYLKLVEHDTFGLFRDTLQGEPRVPNPDPKKDEDYTWEKISPGVGPLVLLREIRKNEIDPRTGLPPRLMMRTVDPRTDKVLELTEVMHYEVNRE